MFRPGRGDDGEKEKEDDPDRAARRLEEEAAALLASRPDWARNLRNVPRATVLSHGQSSAPAGARRNQERTAPSRLDEPGNVETLKAWLRHYQVDEASSEFMKVLHHCAVSYDNTELSEAVDYIRERYEPGYQRPPAPQAQRQRVIAPPEQRFVVAGVSVVVQPRAFQHIPPDLWSAFVAIISTGSLAEKIKEGKDGITRWYQVTSTSDEQFTFPSATAGIRIVASWNAGARALVVYHAHPDVQNYDTYF